MMPRFIGSGYFNSYAGHAIAATSYELYRHASAIDDARRGPNAILRLLTMRLLDDAGPLYAPAVWYEALDAVSRQHVA